MELVSPKFGDLTDCHSQVGKVFSALEKRFHIDDEISAATHVHVSRKDGSFSLPDVRLLSKGALCLSGPLCELVVRETHSLANHQDESSLSDLLKRIDCATDRERIVDLACPSRAHAFNLRRLVDSTYEESERTIEVRRLHDSTNERAAMHWIVMAISMVHCMLEKRIEAIRRPKDLKKNISRVAVTLDNRIGDWLDMRHCRRSTDSD